MSLREDIQQLIRLKLGATELGEKAVYGASEGQKAWGGEQAVMNMLSSYCSGLELAVLRLADEIEALQLGNGES